MSGEGGGMIRGPLVEAEMQFQLQPGGRRATKSAFLLCPKCETQAFIRRSERLTPKVTQMTCHCTNSACGHTWQADIVFVHSLCPGNIERPDLDLPVCPKEDVAHVVPPVSGKGADQQSMFDADPP